MGRVERFFGQSASLAAQAPVGSGSATDPGGILTSYAVSGLFTRFTLQNPATVTDTPDECARFSTPMRDVLGQPASLVLGDQVNLMVWAEDAVPQADTWIWAALTVGAISSSSFGVCFGLAYNATGWRARHLVNTGAGWLETLASATSASTRGVIGQVMHGTINSQARVNCFPVDAAENTLGTANSATNPATMTGWSVTPDTLTWGAGWLTGVGGSGGALARVSPRLLLSKRASVLNTSL